MKLKLNYDVYFDKVYGGWLGKSIAGTIGAPYEGRKELFHYTYDPMAIKEMLPNDDLDLQLIWLHVLENKGIYLDSDDLAYAFYHLYPYVPGEYAYFKKNYARGIYPPFSGSFNNRYYINGNGCPIRSEIWACICPGNPELAASYAAKDGILDHQGDSVYAEQFLAAVEAAAFFESDLFKLFEIGLCFLPEGTKVRRLVEAVLDWCRVETSWEKVRTRIIRDYGHPDCTNMYQNLGFTLLALIYGKGDFIETTMLALNCGFDTDCSCATAGALLGIIQGASFLIERYNFLDTSYVIEAKVERRSNKLTDLAEDTCRVGMTIAGELNPLIEIENTPVFIPIPSLKKEPKLVISVDYQGVPVIGWNESKTVVITLDNKTGKDINEKMIVEIPEGWYIDVRNIEVNILAGGIKKIPLTFTVPKDVSLLYETNIIKISIGNEKTSFGLNGAQVWKVCGPFWENYVSLPKTKLGEWYYDYIKGETEEMTADITRQFHLNTRVVPGMDYIGEPGAAGKNGDICFEQTSMDEHFITNIKEDLFSVSDFIGFQGPCIVYAERRVYCPEDREVKLLVGHTDGYKLWVNGEKVSESNSIDWWTAENKHHKTFLKKGENQILIKCIRHSKNAEFSLIFTRSDKVFPKHIPDLGSYV